MLGKQPVSSRAGLVSPHLPELVSSGLRPCTVPQHCAFSSGDEHPAEHVTVLVVEVPAARHVGPGGECWSVPGSHGRRGRSESLPASVAVVCSAGRPPCFFRPRSATWLRLCFPTARGGAGLWTCLPFIWKTFELVTVSSLASPRSVLWLSPVALGVLCDTLGRDA